MIHLSPRRKRKKVSIPLVVASERGTAQTAYVKACGRCAAGVVGPTWPSRRSAGELQTARVAEWSGKSIRRGLEARRRNSSDSLSWYLSRSGHVKPGPNPRGPPRKAKH